MSFQAELEAIVGQLESDSLIYRTVLPPSKSIAKMIAALSNTKGGYIILGVSEINGCVKVEGLNEDFKAKSITFKAIGLLIPRANIFAEYFHKSGKKLFGIKVEKSTKTIHFGRDEYQMIEGKVVLKTLPKSIASSYIPPVIDILIKKLKSYLITSTEAKRKVIEHYLDALEIIADSKPLLFPDSTSKISSSVKGRLLQRILFSSLADNFETYLSDLLYEIYLAKPQTLKNNQQVTIKEVLECSDMQEFIEYWAKRKISALHKGSVKGFIEDNKQIKELNVIDKPMQNKIEKILQIRHLYTHRNGIVDEKFLKYFKTQFLLNAEHQMSISEMCQNVEYLADVFQRIDVAAINKYSLSVI